MFEMRIEDDDNVHVQYVVECTCTLYPAQQQEILGMCIEPLTMVFSPRARLGRTGEGRYGRQMGSDGSLYIVGHVFVQNVTVFVCQHWQNTCHCEKARANYM